jgi:hypothetical protein
MPIFDGIAGTGGRDGTKRKEHGRSEDSRFDP